MYNHRDTLCRFHRRGQRFFRMAPVLCGMASLLAASDPSPVTDGGPGGIGGEQEAVVLRLWLRASDLELNDGDAVRFWPDRSGDGNHAQAVAPHGFADPDRLGFPAFRAERRHRSPSVEFSRTAPLDGAVTELQTTMRVETDRETFFIVHQPRAEHVDMGLIGYSALPRHGLTEQSDLLQMRDRYQWTIGGFRHGRSALRNVSGASPNLKITTALRHPIADDDAIAIRQNGALLRQTGHGEGESVSTTYHIGALASWQPEPNSTLYDGWIHEVIVFSGRLNSAQRIGIENHLAARHGLALAENQRYWGHTAARGFFALGVFGLGRTDAGDEVRRAGMEGFGMRAVAALADGQWLFAGHAEPRNAYVEEAGWVRWARTWFVQNDDRLRAELAFNAQDAGLPPPGIEPQGYHLLYRAFPEEAFAAHASPSGIAGETIVFVLDEDELPTGYYTLGLPAEAWSESFRPHVRESFAAPVELRFENAETAVINATHWDETQAQWALDSDRNARFFDAVYRFLLVRFPGSATTIHARMSDGYAIERAVLEMRRAGCPWPRTPAGYRMRTTSEAPEPRWRVGVWALKRPWTADAEIGPTWNAYIRGSGYWRAGGARCFSDYDNRMLDSVELSVWSPLARLDVTDVLTARRFGADSVARLRQTEDHGFLVRRTELSHYEFGDRGLNTGVMPLYVGDVRLAVTLRSAVSASASSTLAPSADIAARADRPRTQGTDGMPGTRMPENRTELVEAWRARRRGDMPAWMWEQVESVFNLPYYAHGDPERRDEGFTALLKALDSGDESRYRSVVLPWMLDHAPGWFMGHSGILDTLPLRAFPELLTEVVRYDRAISFSSQWHLPLFPYIREFPDRVFAHKLGGTLNHQAQLRSMALLGAELTGMHRLAEEVHLLMGQLNRQMIYGEGYTQEMGDSYYRGITLAPLQIIARYSQNPLMRLKASLMVEKLLFEDVATYHPGLRQRVSRASRRMRGVHEFVLGQDVVETVLETLTRGDVLIETDRLDEGPEVHGLTILDMRSFPPALVAMLAPWGADWESHAIEDKRLPFRSVFSNYPRCRSRNWRRATHPVHAQTYMGRNYALTSEQTTGGSVSIFASWRLNERPVERVSERGILLLQGRVNTMDADGLDKTPMGALQHENKLIWVVKPPERRFLERGADNLPAIRTTGLRNFRAQAAIHAWGRKDPPEVYINERRIESFPATAMEKDRILIREGVSYIALTPVPATDLGRVHAVRIAYAAPTLTIAAHVLDRPDDVPLTDAFWRDFSDATAGWVVELGDQEEFGGFERFRAHVLRTQLHAEWDAEARVLHVRYQSGEDTMEMGFRTTFERNDTWGHVYDVPDVFAYQRVNGSRPWPAEDVAMDSPLGRMGTAALLEKGGATLRTLEGQTAFLRVEPVSATYVGIQPFVNPSPFEMETPEGVKIQSEGPLGMARITVQPASNRLSVDYALPPPEGAPGLERLRDERGGLFAFGEISIAGARSESARFLRVSGFRQVPEVRLNGRLLPGPFPRTTVNGVSFLLIPIDPRTEW